MSNLNEAARALRDACDAVVVHYGDDAVLGQPPALEAVHQGRRAWLVVSGGQRPAPELAAALSLARDGVAEAAATSAVWYRWQVRAEKVAVMILRASPAAAPGGSQVARSRQSGFDGSACPDCGGFTVRIVGTCRNCTCGWSGGCG